MTTQFTTEYDDTELDIGLPLARPLCSGSGRTAFAADAVIGTRSIGFTVKCPICRQRILCGAPCGGGRPQFTERGGFVIEPHYEPPGAKNADKHALRDWRKSVKAWQAR